GQGFCAEFQKKGGGDALQREGERLANANQRFSRAFDGPGAAVSRSGIRSTKSTARLKGPVPARFSRSCQRLSDIRVPSTETKSSSSSRVRPQSTAFARRSNARETACLSRPSAAGQPRSA